MGMREKAGEISLCGNVRKKRAKCRSPLPNAGGLAAMLFTKTFLSLVPYTVDQMMRDRLTLFCRSGFLIDF